MKSYWSISLLVVLFLCANVYCSKEKPVPLYSQTVTFEPNLSAYNIYQEPLNSLIPNSDYHPITLSSSLFVNYGEKQRLIKLPKGTSMMKIGGGLPTFPEGTILVKTFFYYKDLRTPTLGKRVIETRLLIKQGGYWNAATYVWNTAQTSAKLKLDGLDTPINWIDNSGNTQTITYHVPTEEECITCHQVNKELKPLGPKLSNMNCTITLNNQSTNQLQYFQSLGILDNFDPNKIAKLPNYKDTSLPIEERGRAYLEMNCAHCHNPRGYPKAAKKRYDFRFSVPLEQTRIGEKTTKIWKVMNNGEMPYLGTTVLDQEGIDLISQYLSQL